MEARSEAVISEHIRRLKASGKKVFSNSYLRFVKEEQRWETAVSPESLLILNPDHGVRRLLFYTTDFGDLQNILRKSLASGEEYVLEIVSKDGGLYQDELEDMGFVEIARLSRVSVKDISPIFHGENEISRMADPSIPMEAKEEDTDGILKTLWNVFDTRISHLPGREELCQSIRRGEFCIYKDEDSSNIKAVLQSIVAPKSFYINQVYNGAKKNVIHSILLERLKQYYLNGGRYVYAWVEESNLASLKFHAKYGLQPDGLYTCVYVYRAK